MTTTENLIDLDYTNNPFDLYDKTIWDIKNNEKKQMIEILTTKFIKVKQIILYINYIFK
jgi:hypothetical protein